MENNQIRINIKDIRAIKNADIILNGITVVAGENGCGKSTLSKLLYHTFKIAMDYNQIINRNLFDKLRQIHYSLIKIVDDLLYLNDNIDKKNDTHQISYFQFINNSTQFEEDFISLLNKIKFIVLDSLYGDLEINKPSKNARVRLISSESKLDHNHEFRIKLLLQEILDLVANEDKDIDQLFDELIIKVKAMYSNSRNQMQNRSLDILDSQINKMFGNNNFSSNFNLYEYGVCITDRKLNRLMSLHSVYETVYVDSPISLAFPTTYNLNFSHWTDLNILLKDEFYDNSDKGKDIENIIKNQILYGDTSYVKDSILQESFIYRRDDGSIFNLLDCATGIKSFSILQMLLKKGYLDNKTLLIIDEPEVHLHPQWIIEYARLIVLLNKELGVKFFIASHNPDMVSAIRYISEKEGTLSKLNYYLAQKSEIRHLYNYKHLGIEIDEIFASFNIAIDRINQYGSFE
jgi:predicted ATPase